MTTSTIPAVTALQAQAATNLFLSDRLPDRFTADQPVLNSARDTWHVPVILAYPVTGSMGQVGEVLVNAQIEEVLSHTALEEMKLTAVNLYEANRDAIEAAFL
jgi:hypothetical protein